MVSGKVQDLRNVLRRRLLRAAFKEDYLLLGKMWRVARNHLFLLSRLDGAGRRRVHAAMGPLCGPLRQTRNGLPVFHDANRWPTKSRV